MQQAGRKMQPCTPNGLAKLCLTAKFNEREEDRREQEDEEELRFSRRRPVYSTLNHAQQGIGARA